MKRMVAAAHFTPPVYGMAVAVDNLVSDLDSVLHVRRTTITAPTLYRTSGRYHLIRAMRVLRAIVILVWERRRTSQAFFSCDAGVGMIYTLLLVIAASTLRYRILLQHHSYKYLLHRSRVLATVIRLGSRRCVHLVTTSQMQADFLSVYPGAALRVVGIAGALPLSGTVEEPISKGRLVLGFLGNVTVEKGIGLALDTARAAARAGLPVELRVAGPADRAATALIDAAVNAGEPVTICGPVYSVDRDTFLDGLDVFLFPSRYSHESFGLVAWEAMARGCPVLAHRSGCLTPDAVGNGGLVIDRKDDFVREAVPILRLWWNDIRSRTEAGRCAHAMAVDAAELSREQVRRLCADLADIDAPSGEMASASTLIAGRDEEK